MLEELTVSGGTTNLSRQYTYGLDMISQRQSGGIIHFYCYDGLGSVRLLIDGTEDSPTFGLGTDIYTYDAYGTLIAESHPLGITPNNYLYAGEQWDSDLGRYYNRARYYNPQTGRFWTMDQYEGCCGKPSTLHKYAYGHGDPVNQLDPSGKFSTTHESLAVAAIQVTIASVVIYAVADQFRRQGVPVGLLDPDLLRGVSTREAGDTLPQPRGPFPPPVSVDTQRRSDDCPTLIISKTQSEIPEIAQHIEDAQTDPAQFRPGRLPVPLHVGERTTTFRNANRSVALRGLPDAPPDRSWDEYPFASTLEGGKPRPITSTRLVPIREQRRQGGIINGFYTSHGLAYGDCFYVIIVP